MKFDERKILMILKGLACERQDRTDIGLKKESYKYSPKPKK